MGVYRPQYCARCGRERGRADYGCPTCGSSAYIQSVPGTARPRKEKKLELGGILNGLIALPPSGVVLLHGPRGVGKTQIALQALPNPWVLATEMAPSLVLAYARRIHAPIQRVSTPEWDDETQTLHLDLPTENAPELVFDSLTATQHPAEALSAVRAWCRLTGRRAVVIAQQTKDEQARGPATLGFDVDVEIRLENQDGQRRIIIEKNRFGELGSRAYTLAAQGPVLPSFDRYCSVEGEAGHYRLVSWPSTRKTRYSGYLEAAEKSREDENADLLRLPDPPCAVGALRSQLYPGGWVEPSDWEARQAFAEKHGVPYYSPVKHGKLD